MARRARASQKDRREFLDELAAFSEALRDQIELEVEGFPSGEPARRERISRCREDFGEFCFTYFPHYFSPDGRRPRPSSLQRHLFKRLPEMVTNGAGDHDAIAAPRGETKSTTCALALPIWCILYGIKRYPILLMDSFRQAAEQLEAVKAELESNPRIRQDFPGHSGKGRIWKEGVIVTRSGVKMQAFGAGTRVRGLRHGPHRPDLAVCDDLENDENVRSLEQRDKLDAWLHRTVLPLGPPDGSMDVLYIGTVLHYDAVLSRILKSPFWSGKHFRSVIRWPERMDLWDAWEEQWRNAGPQAAARFYRANLDAMEAGAEVSWPDVRPLLALMEIRVRDRGAFDSEHQNDPVSLENNPFASAITFWVDSSRDWVYYGAVDPSLGRNNRARDPSAVLVGGYNRSTGVLDVVMASVRRRVPDRIISDVIEAQRIYGCQVWGVESVQFQEFLRTELVKRSAQLGVPVPARAVIPHTDKALRIESLQPHMANGLIRLHASQKTLIDQLRHWPDADHDDGPDALHILWMLAVSGMTRTYETMRQGDL